jgi:Family of unknown function (DUF6582)
MPWHLSRRGRQWCVVKNGERDPVPGGCHDDRAQAAAMLRALYANEPQAAVGECSCGGTCESCSRQPVTSGDIAAAVASLGDDARRSAPAIDSRVLADALSARTRDAFSAGQRVASSARTGAITEPLAAPFPRPDYVPRSWYTEQPGWLSPGQGLTVDDSGRVAGYFFEWGENGADVCLIGHAGWPHSCTSPTPSPTGYAAFHQQDDVCDDGLPIRVGAIPLRHASPFGTITDARGHYDDPEQQRILARAYDDEHGAYVLGAVLPGLTYGDVAMIRRCAMSGDWREFDQAWWERNGVSRAAATAVDNFDCLGPVLVTRPGLPLVRHYRGAVMLGGAGGIDVEGAPMAVEQAASDPKKPYGNVTYADPGYQKDKKKRYPLDTEAHVRAAWSYIHQSDNRGFYTAEQLRLIEGRIRGAGKRFGINFEAKAADVGGNGMQQVFLSDGTVLEVPSGSAVEHRDDGTMVVTVGGLTGDGDAELQAAAAPPGSEGPPMGEQQDGGGDTGARLDALEERVGMIEQALQQLVQQQLAAAEESIPLPA